MGSIDGSNKPTNGQHFYAFDQTEWSTYSKYRPVYPPSLVKMISSYHHKHCGRYDLAHDVASGSGVFVPVLAQDLGFKHVHVSDVAETNIDESREILGKWLSEQQQASEPQTTLTFSHVVGEKMHTCTANGSVDLVTIMEAAHWMDAPKFMSSAADTIAPNGTLAIVLYGAPVFIKHSARADAAFKKAVGATLRYSLEKRKASNTNGVSNFEKGLTQGCAGLDFIAIDDALWKNVRRIRLRGGGKGDHPHDTYYTSEPHFAPSQVRPDEQYEHYEEQDEEASGWDLEVDRDWFYGYLTSFLDPEHVAEMEEYKAFTETLTELPAGKILIDWTIDVILATRKE